MEVLAYSQASRPNTQEVAEEDYDLQVTLHYTLRPCLHKTTQHKTKHTEGDNK